jgi:hypothetical protein
MKKILYLVLIFAILSITPICKADTFTFSPTPPDLYDLDHHYYFTWGINWELPSGHTLVDVTLTIKKIDDWTNEDGDHLYIHLLDSATAGVTYGYDGQGYADQFSGNPLIADYQDPAPGNETLVYSFKSLGLLPTFLDYIADGNFGIGFDPDCHYWNDGVTLEITTVPEPTTLLLLGTGLISFAIFSRRKLTKK